jgi:hypothetical protein
MNTASDILSYAVAHDIYLSANGEELKVNAPKEALTDEFLKSAKVHKIELLETLSKPEKLIETACRGLDITPAQFRTICSKKDLDDISEGSIPFEELRAYACSFADGIKSGRILFHPVTSELVRHGISCRTSSKIGIELRIKRPTMEKT